MRAGLARGRLDLEVMFRSFVTSKQTLTVAKQPGDCDWQDTSIQYLSWLNRIIMVRVSALCGLPLSYHDDTTSGPLPHPGLTASCSTHWAYSVLLHPDLQPDLHPLRLQRPAPLRPPPRPPPTGPKASCSTRTGCTTTYWLVLSRYISLFMYNYS